MSAGRDDRATSSAAQPWPPYSPGAAAQAVARGRELERSGRLVEAAAIYERVIVEAGPAEDRVAAEAMRLLAGIRRRQHDLDAARALCQRSFDLAIELGDRPLAADALNGAALVMYERGDRVTARTTLERALALAGDSDTVRARIYQNLGIIANGEGDFYTALGHYQRSLDAFRAAKDMHGCATAFHNLGMISADRRLWREAEAYFAASLEIADELNDVHLRAHVLLNRTEALLEERRFPDARDSASAAFDIFARLGSRDGMAAASKFLGVLSRETGEYERAAEELALAIELASEVGSLSEEAEALRELALMHERQGRIPEAIRLLTRAHVLFGRIGARVDQVDVSLKMGHLERETKRVGERGTRPS